ncbi:hypothetical protein AJ87_02420 [Rhizobium yanglingense]|nr:hypothetical protein AJ87_02420 [Rhizobium yanglingense]
MSTASVSLPNWITYALIPVLNLIVAFLISGVVVWLIGESPLGALSLLIEGALGSGEGIGFTLYYATSFIFTGLSVAVAIHAGLFNIGSEGQAYLGGLGCALVALALDRFVPWYVTMPLPSSVPAFSAPPGHPFQPSSRQNAAATSSSRPSCSITSARR